MIKRQETDSALTASILTSRNFQLTLFFYIVEFQPKTALVNGYKIGP